MLLKFEQAIEFFLKALTLEKEHSNIILKNLIKTVFKYISKEESDEFNEKIDHESKRKKISFLLFCKFYPT